MEDSSQNKIEAYFYTLESHIFKPIEERTITSSCYATLFLLFTIIDSMVRLTDNNVLVIFSIPYKFEV